MAESDSSLEKVMANQQLLALKGIQPNDSLGVTQDYNKLNRNKLFDDVLKRKEFKNKAFAGKKTMTDGVTGEIIHKSHKAAFKKYKGSWSAHASETDHIVSLERGHGRLKLNPFLSDHDVKSILNDEKNLREVSKNFNASKGERSDFSVKSLPAHSKLRLVRDNLKAEGTIAGRTTYFTVRNMGNDFAAGAVNALEASAIPIMVEGVHNLVLVANGDKKIEEAARDFGRLTARVAASGGGMQVLTTGVGNLLKNSANEALKKIGSSNQVSQVITITLILTQSMGKYLNGEITGEDFFREISESGVGLMSGALGAVIGQWLIPVPYAGAVVGSLIISSVCTGIFRAYYSLNEHKAKIARIDALASRAEAEMERQRNLLKEMIGKEFAEWDKQFNQGFDEIFNATLTNNVNGIAAGLDRLLQVFGESVKFKSIEEFDDFFMDEKATLSL